MKNIYTLLSAIILVLYGCKSSQRFEKTDSGLEYYFAEQNDTAQTPQVGDAVVISMQIFGNDSLLFDTREISSNYRLMLRENQFGQIYEGISKMHIGDSAVFHIKAINFYQVTTDAPLPYFIKKDDILTFYVKLNDILTPDEIQIEQDRINRMKLKNEQILLSEYLNKNNLIVTPQSSGLYYIELKKGNGIKPAVGDTVTVHYEGKFINNQIFDSSIKTNTPFTFILGDSSLIDGWNEGIGLMKVGGIAELIIPSNLGYGATGAGLLIPPYSTLIFEIHLLNVKKLK